jgi:hypothetical protein
VSLEGDRLIAAAGVTTTFRELTGRPPRSLAQFVRDHASAGAPKRTCSSARPGWTAEDRLGLVVGEHAGDPDLPDRVARYRHEERRHGAGDSAAQDAPDPLRQLRHARTT